MAGMPKLTVVLERKPVRVFEVNSSVINIGRAADMQLMIDDASVSRRQAQIRFGAHGSWQIEDLGSINGTFLNGQRLTSVQPVKRGDEISFGKFSLFFDSAISESAGPEAAAAFTSGGALTETMYMSAEEAERLRRAVAQQRRAQLQWEAKGQRGTFFLATGGALVGRSPLCDLQVPAGPKQHLLVLRTQFGCEVRNLSWWHHMKVNGWALEQATLQSGDVIEIGGLRVTFLDELVQQTSRSARQRGSASVDATAS
jgi:pSer/pThr/pTyr-binding forkhead associated (FHA) protein